MHNVFFLLLTVCILISCVLCGRFEGLRVAGNQLKNGKGEVVRLIGVNRSGSEFACIHDSPTTSIFDGPSDEASIRAILAWSNKINAIRVPMNSICWLGINGVPEINAGKNYIRELKRYVDMLTDTFDMAVILDLHWTAPGTQIANKQRPMPDQDHVVDFWIQVANEFKGYPNVIFDVFNEPFPCFDKDVEAAWKCWKNGGTSCAMCFDVNFKAVGMDSLVQHIRDTGSKNIIMLGGLQYSNSLSKWLEYYPKGTDNIVASWHSYNFNPCSHQECWDSNIRKTAAVVPVITGEIGENDCAHGYIDKLMQWLDQYDISYLAWTWNTWDCKQGPALIKDYNGTPTDYGMGYRAHLQ